MIRVRSWSFAHVCAAAALTALAVGCGGGGGGHDIELSAPSIAFVAVAGDPSAQTKDIQFSWSNPTVALWAVGVPAEDPIPTWLDVDLTGDSSPVTLHIRRLANPGAVGRRTATLRIATGNAYGELLDYVDLPVTLDVIAAPSLSTSPLAVAWTESEGPAPTEVTVSHDARQQLVGAAANVSWLGASATGDVLTIGATPDSQALAPGQHAATVAVSLLLDGQASTLNLPVTATVGRALSGPAQLSLEVNASTTETELAALRATVVTATASPLQLQVSSNVTWLATADATTGAANNVALAIPRAQVQGLDNGTYAGTLTISSPTPYITALQIPFTLTVRLPEVHYVAPVAFTDTAATDYVIVRGEGLDDPAAVVRIDGAEAATPNVVSDTEVRLVPGARAAGDYGVDATNLLGLARPGGMLRVVAPPAFDGSPLPAAIGLQEHVVPSSGDVVFTTMCYFCGGITPGGTPSTVQRFVYVPGSEGGTWSRTQYSYPELYDVAFTPDESVLLVLTRTDLRFVDPATMVTQRTVALPRNISATARQLAVTNDGLVLIQDLGQAYSLHEGRFVSIPGLIFDVGLAASRDGSRVFFGEATNSGDVPYRYYDASTGAIVLSSNRNHYSRGTYSRHAERAMTNSYLLDSSLTMLLSLAVNSHTGDLSPDGNRAYGYDVNTGRLRIVDVTNPQQPTELPFIQAGPAEVARVATHPHGGFVFVAGESFFTAVDVR